MEVPPIRNERRLSPAVVPVGAKTIANINMYSIYLPVVHMELDMGVLPRSAKQPVRISFWECQISKCGGVEELSNLGIVLAVTTRAYLNPDAGRNCLGGMHTHHHITI
jgi:hypothetical protein